MYRIYFNFHITLQRFRKLIEPRDLQTHQLPQDQQLCATFNPEANTSKNLLDNSIAVV